MNYLICDIVKRIVIFENFMEWVRNNFGLNRSILFLTSSDIFTWGLYLPLISMVGLYLSQVLKQDTVTIVGTGVAIYYLIRSITQIPVGFIIDKIGRDHDDIIILIVGNVLLGLPFLIYPLIESQNTFFILQAFAGLGAGMNLVSWRKLFAKNLDRSKEGTSYAIYDTILSGMIALFSLLIGVIANIGRAYFDFIMIFTGILIISSIIWPILIFTDNKRKSNEGKNS